MKLQFVEAGEIVTTHGVKGEMKVLTWLDDPEMLCEFDRVRIDGKEYNVENCRVQKTCNLLKVTGIDTMESAQAMRGKVVELYREDIDEKVIFAAELIGVEVFADGESIGNIKVVRAFGHEAATMEQFDEINGRLKKASLRAIFFSSLTNPCTRFVNSVVYAGVGLTGALIAIAGGISVGNLTSFLNYANQYTKPFNEISGVVTELQNALACAGRVFELIEAPSQTPDPEPAVSTDEVDGKIEIRDLKFSYTPDKPLIDDFNLSVQSGQRIAIVGPTGCGKTTFINLLIK